MTKPVFQVVGYQDSGKTTLTVKLIERLSAAGVKAGTIKHHGHGGMPEIGDRGKDTARHREAGASSVLVEGGGLLNLSAASENGWEPGDFLKIYEQLPVDVILIEGYKKEPYPKAVLLRTEEDLHLLDELENIKAVICWFDLQSAGVSELPVFHINEEDEYLTSILKELEG
nr:molybdopterin-guanine dinucleotide biosynthesis protein B [Bacillus marinisedimentorum]